MKKLILILASATFTAIYCTEILNEKINFNLEKKAMPCIIGVKNNGVGNVEISTHDQNIILIDILKETTTKERLQKLEVKIENSDQKISIEAINNNKESEKEISWHWWSGWWFTFNSYTVNSESDRIDLKIKIPMSCAVDVNTNNGNINLENIDKSISIKSNLGSIDINNVGNSVSVESNNGKLNMNDIKGHLKIKSNLGNVSIADIQDGLDAEVTKGDVSIYNANGSLDVSVTKGSIDLHQTKLQDSGEIDFDTTVGSINLYLPPTQNAWVKAKTTVGSININNKKASSSFRVGNSFKGSLQAKANPKLKISLRTTKGAITVNKQK